MEKEIHKKKIKVTKKLASSSSNPKAPAGKIFYGNEAFTCWDKDSFEEIKEGTNLILSYYVSMSNMGGTEYQNNNITKIEYALPGEEVEEPKEKQFNSSYPKEIIKSMGGIINIGGRFFKVSSIELEEVNEDGRTENKN